MKAANAGQGLALAMVDEFARAGMAHACLAPGSRSAPLAMALAADSRIRLHVVLDERSASFLALGIAKATRRPVPVLSTSGTGAANFHPAVLEAHHSRTPLVVLTADRPPELRDTGANQTIDQINLYAGAVRWFVEVGVPEARPASVGYWRSVASRACAAASGPPAGPVHLNLAFREPLVPVPDETGFPYRLDGRPAGAPWTRASHAPRPASESDVAEIAAEIASIDRGLIVAGDCRVDPSPVLALAAAANWPVLAEPISGLRCGELAISTYEALLRHEPFAGAHRPELVIRVGRTGTGRALASFLDPEVRQILFDPDCAWPDPERSVAWVLDADPTVASRQVLERLSRRSGSSWMSSWLRGEQRARSAIDALLDADEAPSEPRVARDLAETLPSGATLVVASSMPVRDLEWFMRPRAGLRIIANRGASGIDGFVSTALGAALAGPGPTVALAGDLSMLHDQNGLGLARSEAVAAVFVVVNNAGGGIFHFLPQAAFPEHFEQLFATPHGLRFEDLARLYGCGYEQIARAGDLAPAVVAATQAGGVHVLEVRTDREANVAVHRRVWEAVARALGDKPAS